MGDAPLVLVVDDEVPNLDLFVRLFDDDFAIVTAPSAKEALAILAKEDVAVIVSDQRMPEMTGVDLLAEASAKWPDVRRILLTAYSDRELLLDAIKRGHVHEYVVKPWDEGDVRLRLEAAIAAWRRNRDRERATRERAALRAEIEERSGGFTLVGIDAALRATIDKLAKTDAPLVIRGETGTGKELVARAIHRASARRDAPFVRASCRGNATLFGAGGRLEQAEGGTLFLASVADLSSESQTSLLAALDEGARTRIIASTSASLEDLVKARSFREDLFFRLNVVPLRLAPLRERANDVDVLARHFTASFGDALGKTLAISGDAIASLERYDWPGNVRELRNVLERAAILTEHGATLEREDLLFDFAAPIAPKPASLFDEISADEANRVKDALKEAAGNRARAARILGIPRTTLADRIKRLGIT